MTVHLHPPRHIFAVKMDTEGAEIKILRGMRKLLSARKVANLVVEIRAHTPPPPLSLGASIDSGSTR